MEMHQVRYFLAVARALNFTRAAEECHVAQPSLTRAIRQLEGELGGDLFRRERPHAQLTELGQRMLPLLKQCYDSALSARSLASAIKKGEVGSLRLALSRTIDPSLVTPHVVELGKLFQGLELKLLRGTGIEVLEYLKKGDVELGSPHRSARNGSGSTAGRCSPRNFSSSSTACTLSPSAPPSRSTICRQERLMVRTYCETTPSMLDLLRAREFDVTRFHEVSADGDLLALLEAGLGVALVPRSTQSPATLARIVVQDIDLKRTVNLYGVAGRQRTPVASAMMKMLRAYDWSRYAAA